MIKAFLGLGANMGDCLATLQGARKSLRDRPGIQVVGSAALYETIPVGGPPGQSNFLNTVLEVATTLSAEKLLADCLSIENRFGRKRLVQNGPRTLDIDLLFFGDLVCRTPDLVLPHPRLHRRAFVLIPLCDLAPGLLHPLLGKTIRKLCDQLPDDQGVHRLAENW